MKFDFKPKLNKLEGPVLAAFTVPSESSPGKRYMVVVLGGPLDIPEAVCTCPGYVNNQKCWHQDAALERIVNEGK